MTLRRHLSILLGMLMLVATCAAGSEAPRPITNLRPTVILISLDGFRYDYLDKGGAPNLQHLSATGVRAQGLLPCFPTYTFPNHYSIVTGLYPAHHGIVANEMYDPVRAASFRYDDRAAEADARWWGGEPIWLTAQKQGQKTGTMFWPGSEAPIGGIRPDHWERFDPKLSPEDRVNKVLAWLDLPAKARPTFLTIYFEQVDHAGHEYGPDSPEVRAAVSQVDGAIGLLLAGLRQRGIQDKVNIIALSDHGMAAASPDRVLFLDDYLDVNRVRIVTTGPFLTLWPRQGGVDQLVARLKKMPHVKVYRRGLLPERWHYTDNPRIAPVIALADEGWTIVSSHAYQQSHKPLLGQHGYDNNLPSMRGIFVAHGPAFKRGTTLPAFPNIDIYDLLAYVLRLEPAENDGSLAVFRPVLVRKALSHSKQAVVGR